MLPELTKTTTDTEKLVAYLQDTSGKAMLSPVLQEKLQMVNTASDLMQAYRSRLKVYPMLMRKYNIKRSRAYELIEIALEIYAIHSQQKSREFYIDIVIEEIRKTKEMAVLKRDPRAANSADKNLMDVIDKFFGNEEVNDYENMLPVQVVAVFNPETTGTKLPENWQAEVEKLKAAKNKTIDISHE